MTTDLIEAYISSHSEPKQSELRKLHELSMRNSPGCRLWFSDGRNADGKVISNPSIGYGQYTIKYADGSTREFCQIALSAIKTGISIYILGLEDKTYLSRTFGPSIGKASVTGYCIRFRCLKDINLDSLEEAIKYGFSASGAHSGDIDSLSS